MKSKPKAKTFPSKKILQILTGSIAAYKAGDLVRVLKEAGFQVTCVLTEAAKKFVTPLTLRAISGEPVYDDFFSPKTQYGVLHTSLAEESDLILISPASADFIARLAAGFADDLGSCIVLATRKPILIVPAMNDQMYQHPITQENILKLKSIGYQVMEPVVGHLVCGREAIGHIPSDADILQTVQRLLKK